MRKIIFILTYNEGKEWCNFYKAENYKRDFPDNYLLIFLDNGNQSSIKDWCKKTNSIHFVSENNIGTTGGYNWFIKVGALLKASRIAVMQADVQVHNPMCFSLLFRNEIEDSDWDYKDFIYWPNAQRNRWNADGLDSDAGQFFSLDPTFFIHNDYLCDENFTVTHFESTDLFLRMTAKINDEPARPINLLKFFPDKDVNREELTDYTDQLYSIRSFTNHEGLHNKWFEYNYDYFRKKWMRNLPIPLEYGWKMWGINTSLWLGPPWASSKNKEKFSQSMWHRRGLDVHRNLQVDQLPYPVEWEVNRFYINFVKTGLVKIGDC